MTKETLDTKVQKLLKRMKNTNALYNAVISDIVHSSEAYRGETLIERLQDKCNDVIGGRNYNAVPLLEHPIDATAFFNKHKVAITTLIAPDRDVAMQMRIYARFRPEAPRRMSFIAYAMITKKLKTILTQLQKTI